ncbi:MAG: bacillithiol biosynthesis BshC, partial [Candidatus Kapaibacterium sp.]
TDDLLVRMEGFDKSLVAAVLALRKAVANELDALERKVTAAARRKQEEQLKRRREIHFFIFPDERLQERVIAPISLMRVARESAVGPIIDVIGNHPIGHHFMISESAPGTTRT